MGFPDEFRIPVSDTQAYKQFGNSVVMPVMREVARVMDGSVREKSEIRANTARQVAVK
jgi:DNA (cytosine-5)-methyltransferase 1